MYFGARILILDEPTSALGVKEAGVVLRLIQAARADGIAVIFITHNAHHALITGDRFTILIHGTVADQFGFRIIRFDNRDCGLSQKFPQGRYLLADMAEDASGLLEALHIDRAHVVGQSLGGMIAQELVLRRPDKVSSLCLIYTAPDAAHIRNERDLIAVSARPSARSREEAIEQYLQAESFCASQAYELDTAWIRELGGLIWDGCYYPEGIPRQLDAIWRSRDRTAALGAVTAPTLIIHGDADRLIDVSGSHALARALPHATLRIFPGMGHELPSPLWPELVHEITANANGQQSAEPGNTQRASP